STGRQRPRRSFRERPSSSTSSSVPALRCTPCRKVASLPGHGEGSPADPHTGGLFRAHPDGTMTELMIGLDRPASLEFVGNHAYVVTLTGQLWTIEIRGWRETPLPAASSTGPVA